MKRNPSMIFLLGYLAYASTYTARLNLSVVSPMLLETGIMTRTQIGYLGGVFFVTYAFGQLINGRLGDRGRPHRMMVAGLTGTGLTNLLIGLFPQAGWMFVLWGLNGYAQSMIWGPLLRIVISHFPPTRSPYIASLLGSSIAVGSVGGLFLASGSLKTAGIGPAFILPGCLCLLNALLIALFFRGQNLTRMVRGSSGRSAFSLFCLLPVLFIAMLQGVLKDNVNLWSPSFFFDRYAIDIGQMALYVFLIPTVSLLGRLLYPPAFRLCGQREHRVSCLSFLGCTIAAFPLCFRTLSPVWALVCLCGIALFISLINTSLLSVFPMRFQAAGQVSFVAGITDFATYVGAGAGSFVYGIVLDHSDYSIMYLSWVVLAALAAAIVFYTERKEEQCFHTRSPEPCQLMEGPTPSVDPETTADDDPP